MVDNTLNGFRDRLERLLGEAAADGHPRREVSGKELHTLQGGYPGSDHRMPVCCSVMRRAMRPGDRIVSEPPKGNGASLTVSYQLPRGDEPPNVRGWPQRPA